MPAETFAVAKAKNAIASPWAKAMVKSRGTVSSPSVKDPVMTTDPAPKNTNRPAASNSIKDARQASVDAHSCILKFVSISGAESVPSLPRRLFAVPRDLLECARYFIRRLAHPSAIPRDRYNNMLRREYQGTGKMADQGHGRGCLA